MNKWILIALSGLILLNGCGFKLKGSHSLPSEFAQLQVLSQKPYGMLGRALKEKLMAQDVTVLSSVSSHLPTLSIGTDNLDRRLLSLFASGQVAEYELVYSVNYQLVVPGQDPVDHRVEVLREYQDDPDAVLAKSRELDLILSEMRQQAADRILRQLAQYQSGTVTH